MFTININKECGCFKKSDYQNNQSFKSKDEAHQKAQEMIKDMNENFCQKHSFELNPNGNDMNIIMSLKS